jgi:hypothetical protein
MLRERERYKSADDLAEDVRRVLENAKKYHSGVIFDTNQNITIPWSDRHKKLGVILGDDHGIPVSDLCVRFVCVCSVLVLERLVFFSVFTTARFLSVFGSLLQEEYFALVLKENNEFHDLSLNSRVDYGADKQVALLIPGTKDLEIIKMLKNILNTRLEQRLKIFKNSMAQSRQVGELRDGNIQCATCSLWRICTIEFAKSREGETDIFVCRDLNMTCHEKQIEVFYWRHKLYTTLTASSLTSTILCLQSHKLVGLKLRQRFMDRGKYFGRNKDKGGNYFGRNKGCCSIIIRKHALTNRRKGPSSQSRKGGGGDVKYWHFV